MRKQTGQSFMFLYILLSVSNIQGLAERITPISVKHSGTKNGHEAYYAIDKDNSTWSQTEKDAQKKTFAWIKFTLDKSYCIKQVLWFIGAGTFIGDFSTYVWSGSQFSSDQEACGGCTVSVYEEGIDDNSDESNYESECVRGDTVKIEKNGNNIIVNELVVLTNPSEDKSTGQCRELDEIYEHVITSPTLPLESGSGMLLGCKRGFVNVRGKHASCNLGRIVFTEEGGPLCLRTSEIS
ncbi:hypothetical protein ACHWQZ_G013899 [Mnemiopsis leidyi]